MFLKQLVGMLRNRSSSCFTYGMNANQLLRIAQVRAQGTDGTARRIREAAGISLREAAAALQTNAVTLHRWERGETRPRTDSALAWADLLDTIAKVRV